MADRYAALTGSATAPYETWAKAASLLTIATAAAAGDRVFVDQNHNQSLASWAMAWAGTPSNPIRIYVVDRTGDPEPPNASHLSFGATLTQTGNGGSITGCIYVYGLYVLYTSSSSTTFNICSSSGDIQFWEKGGLIIQGSGSGSRLALGSITAGADNLLRLKDMELGFGAGGQRIGINNRVIIEGGGFTSGTAAATGLVELNNSSRGADLLLDGVDLSFLSSSFDLATKASQASRCVARHCKLPASWTGEPADITTFTGAASSVWMYQCGNTFSKKMIRGSEYQAQLKEDLSLYLDGGAGSADGIPFSWSVVTGSNIAHPLNAFRSPEIVFRITEAMVGSPVTLNVKTIIGNGVVLHDEDIWLDLDFYSAVGGVGITHVDNRRTPLDSATNWPTNTDTWASEGGITDPVKQTLSITFTPTEAGIAHLHVLVARPSTNMRIDPLVTATGGD